MALSWSIQIYYLLFFCQNECVAHNIMGNIMYRYILRRIKKSQTTQRCEINCCNDRERTERRAKKFPLIKNWEFSLRESCVNEGHETIW